MNSDLKQFTSSHGSKSSRTSQKSMVPRKRPADEQELDPQELNIAARALAYYRKHAAFPTPNQLAAIEAELSTPV
jgi:hypothetical protein